MQPKGSLQCSQEPATGPYPELNRKVHIKCLFYCVLSLKNCENVLFHSDSDRWRRWRSYKNLLGGEEVMYLQDSVSECPKKEDLIIHSFRKL
jgi:hypothetical protein